MSSEIQKVVAYITNGRRLLVFKHTDFPEAGIQVPAGTVDPGEAPETAVLREAYEESGIEQLILVQYLGKRRIDQTTYGKVGHVVRHFFHLHCPGLTVSRWRHMEQFPSEGPDGPIEFELYWARWPDEVPALAGELGALLTAINRDSLS